MILSEYLHNNTLVRHYSDKNVMLLQVETGIKYSDPIDIMPCKYTYEETEELIEVEELVDTEIEESVENE